MQVLLFKNKLPMPLNIQIIYLFILAIPVACISWTVTHEEIFKEPREFCVRCSKSSRWLIVRKFFYLFTCEYCFSHYISIGMIIITGYHLLFNDWRGLLIANFSLVWVANMYMSLFYLLRTDIKKGKTTIEELQNKEESKK